MTIQHLDLIDKTQENSNCRLCVETSNHIVSECNKLTQKEYKNRLKWVGKVIHENCARTSNFTILTNGICTNENFA